MLDTMQNQHNEGYRADSGAKPAVIQAVIEAIAAIGTPHRTSQVETKIGTFKKDLKNWLKLTNEISGFGKDPETGAITASEEQWDILLAIPANKKAYGRFRTKPLANEELLSTLFLDSLTTGANARTPYDIAINVDAEDGEDADAKADQEEEETLHNRLALELEQAYKETNQEEKADTLHDSLTFAPSTPTSLSRPPLSTSSSAASLKRTTADQDISKDSRKRSKLIGSELLAQTLGGLNKRIDTLFLQMAEESRSIAAAAAAASTSWSERALKIVTKQYMNLSSNDILDLMNIVRREEDARLFVCVPEALQREWALKRLNQRWAPLQ